MRTTDDLRRELRERARATEDWALPAPALPDRPGRHTPPPHGLRHAGLVLAAAAAVVAVAVVPRLVGDDTDVPPATVASPSPTGSPSAAPAVVGEPRQDWEVLGGACLAETPECVAADHVRLDDLGLFRTSLSSVRTRDQGRTQRWYSSTIIGPHPGLHAMVGAVGATSRSRLSYRVNDGPWVAVPRGRPSLVSVPDEIGRTVVLRLRETGRPLPDETLVTAFYIDG
ncbi:hypothetical protein SAMN04488570_1926 [Nocardioides scoriae]|uniref:Uncharacterized protein n=1 Tax=Nocardioides scoriae TaxID=642780 RepID=A0A1H1SDW7_9ACTN|nr:hypothetical protein [Nocardioides scoriae]SDS45998.1 hypothetical protein SAMN04488570_1926 [Nocardioides scoriae]